MQAVPSDGTTPDLIAAEDDGQGSLWLRGLSAAGEQLWHTRLGGSYTFPDEVRAVTPDNLGLVVALVTNFSQSGAYSLQQSIVRLDGMSGRPTWRYNSEGMLNFAELGSASSYFSDFRTRMGTTLDKILPASWF